MTRVRQFYGDELAPILPAATADEVSSAWRSHRTRLRAWIRDLPEAAWSRPTRCSAWNVTDLVQHLISGSQFLGYTLHEAHKGAATTLLADFDPQGTPGAAAKMFAGMGTAELVAALDAVDRSVAKELDRFDAAQWQARAESPLGHVPAYLSVNHFLFDSWVHERDLMLPAGEVPVLDENEAAAVASYVVALAGVARTVDEGPHPPVTLRIGLTDIDRQLTVTAAGGKASVTTAAVSGDADAIGTTDDVVHLATGRPVSPQFARNGAVHDYLTNLARVMA